VQTTVNHHYGAFIGFNLVLTFDSISCSDAGADEFWFFPHLGRLAVILLVPTGPCSPQVLLCVIDSYNCCQCRLIDDEIYQQS